MNQLVTHPGYSTPRDVRVLRAKIRGEVLHCLANDTKASLNGVLDQFVVEEGILFQACDVTGDGVDTRSGCFRTGPKPFRSQIPLRTRLKSSLQAPE